MNDPWFDRRVSSAMVNTASWPWAVFFDYKTGGKRLFIPALTVSAVAQALLPARRHSCRHHPQSR
jgi:hypothetical protein